MVLAFLVALLATPSRTRLVFAGDLMLNRAVPGQRVLAGVRGILESGDAAFANLEIPLTTAKAFTGRKSAEEVKRHDQYILKASPLHAPYLRLAGLDAVSLGNNHCMDYGSAGLEEMKRALDGAGIVYAGAGDNVSQAAAATVVRLKSGLRVGLVSAMAFMTAKALAKTTPAEESTAGVNTLSFGGIIGPVARASLRDWIAQTRQVCDYVVVGVHWGVERKTIPNVYQVTLGRALVDAGADVVWGNHPHVLQGAEVYHGVPILYSMGNLVASLPSETGLVRLSVGDQPRFEFFPASVRDNACQAVTGPAGRAAKRAFREACVAIQRKYPSQDSAAPVFR